jgi:hypothetical protein
MWLNFYMFLYVAAIFVLIYKHLILFRVQYASCPCIWRRYSILTTFCGIFNLTAEITMM